MIEVTLTFIRVRGTRGSFMFIFITWYQVGQRDLFLGTTMSAIVPVMAVRSFVHFVHYVHLCVVCLCVDCETFGM